MEGGPGGNPNAGKTTLFNALTGSNQYVGNWPGVTVEKKEGIAKVGELSFTLVDLPGIYSLSPYSMEEIVARRFIIEEKPTPSSILWTPPIWSGTSTSPCSFWSWSGPRCWR